MSTINALVPSITGFTFRRHLDKTIKLNAFSIFLNLEPTLAKFLDIFLLPNLKPTLSVFQDIVRFEFFTAVTMKNGAFWGVTPCGSCKNQRFGGT
jgi:hypothetical protein